MINYLIKSLLYFLVSLSLGSSVLASTTVYQYDNLHRLTHVERSDGTVSVYEYDELGNRTLKVTTTAPSDYFCDNDGDGFIDSSSSGTCNGYGCQPTGCQTTSGNDCDDADPVINPDTPWYEDVDGDGFGNPVVAYVQCTQPSGPPDYVLDNTDYNDSDPNIYPGGPPVRISGTTPSYHSTLQEAYNASGDNDVLQCQETTFIENLTINIDKSVTIEGGYDGTYSTPTGSSTLQGDIDINEGVLTIENFILE